MSQFLTTTRVSAGGVAFRQIEQQTEIVLILVGPYSRWQLPKGTVDADETIEHAAQREVREETGLNTEMFNLIDRIEYWFYANQEGKRTRFHKFVYFYLMRYLSGNVSDHDHEAEEARWVNINDAIPMLSFESERSVAEKARQVIFSQFLKKSQPDMTGLES